MSFAVGTGRVGVWRAGVEVEPLEGEGSFNLSARADIGNIGEFVADGSFRTSGSAWAAFNPQTEAPEYEGTFSLSSAANTGFEGELVIFEFTGEFALTGVAASEWAYIPDIGPGAGDGVPKRPGRSGVVTKTQPGGAVRKGATAGAMPKSGSGRVGIKTGQAGAKTKGGQPGARPQ